MAINASKVTDLINLLFKIGEAKRQGLLANPQADEMVTEIKAEIDTEIAA